MNHATTQAPYAVLYETVATGMFPTSGYGVSPLPLLSVGFVALDISAYSLSEHATINAAGFGLDAD